LTKMHKNFGTQFLEGKILMIFVVSCLSQVKKI
jgi:hypothetical protein